MANIINFGAVAADLSGTAGTGQVLNGYTFYKDDPDSKLTGSLVPAVSSYTLWSNNTSVYGLTDGSVSGFTARSSVDTGDTKSKRWVISMVCWSDRDGNAMYFQGSNNNSSWSNLASKGYNSGTYGLFATGTSTYRYYRVSFSSNSGRYQAFYSGVIDKTNV